MDRRYGLALRPLVQPCSGVTDDIQIQCRKGRVKEVQKLFSNKLTALYKLKSTDK